MQMFTRNGFSYIGVTIVMAMITLTVVETVLSVLEHTGVVNRPSTGVLFVIYTVNLAIGRQVVLTLLQRRRRRKPVG